MEKTSTFSTNPILILSEGDFFRLFFISSSILFLKKKGGEAMDNDEYIFEMFLEIMEQIENNDTDGRLRMISKNPRHAEAVPAEQKTNRRERLHHGK